MAQSYTWTGGNAGVWSDPANWTDITSGAVPATVPPGASDNAVLTGGTASLLVVNGPGQADLITLSNQVQLNGSINVGTLVQSGQFAMVTGSLIAMAGGTISGIVDEIGGGIMMNGLTIDGGSLIVEPGAFMEIGTDGTADGSVALVVDANSVMTMMGGSLSVGGVLNNGTILASSATSAPLSGTNAGQMFGLSADGLFNTGTIASGENQSISVDNLSGAGEVDVSAGGTVRIGQGVSATVVFQDPSGVLAIDPAGLDSDAITVQGFSGGDIISIGGTVDSAVFTPNGWGDGTLTVTTGGSSYAIDIQGNYDSAEAATFSQNGTVGLSLPCFTTGTLIRTPAGEVPVETLRPGDEVVTLLPAGHRTIRWVGHRAVRLTGARSGDLQPVRVRAGTFGPGLPARDLCLSPDHALFADGVLVPVKYLVNGDSIARLDVETVTYWHVEFDCHDVLLAEGLPAESYLDTGDRASFANGGSVTALQPRFGPLTWEAEGCAPLHVTGAVVDRLRALATTVSPGASATPEQDATPQQAVVPAKRTGGRRSRASRAA